MSDLKASQKFLELRQTKKSENFKEKANRVYAIYYVITFGSLFRQKMYLFLIFLLTFFKILNPALLRRTKCKKTFEVASKSVKVQQFCLPRKLPVKFIAKIGCFWRTRKFIWSSCINRLENNCFESVVVLKIPRNMEFTLLFMTIPQF